MHHNGLLAEQVPYQSSDQNTTVGSIGSASLLSAVQQRANVFLFSIYTSDHSFKSSQHSSFPCLSPMFLNFDS